ncbi:MAG: mannitol 2-dehydrogenase [Rhizobiaceae bacterium MnEN-MB40S]|nr:MAG: mannitol 2-dehydrogenase [Rhizobiaceae bacterium MnEN-MB40S]
MPRLDRRLLEHPPKGVSVPAYDRSALTSGIVHIGVGNFHRAHQQVYLDRLFSMGEDHDWAITGAGVKPYDAKMRATLEMQDWLTTVLELDPAGYTARICGAMIDFAEIDAGAIIAAMARPETRIVSLTITEGGYYLDAKRGGFQADHPDIVADSRNPDAPSTVFGMLIAGLVRRREAGLAPFTVMSCDNLPDNGKVCRDAVTGLAGLISPELGDWIAGNVAFPSGMVDCITPATGDRERKLLQDTFGIEDASPVVCEPFRQWVLEDHFPLGRPALEKVGVEFVPDVGPFELMKLRILNGGHAAIAYPSGLMGLRFAHDAMDEPLVRGFLEKLEHSEIIPTVPPVPGVDLDDYFGKVAERFSNPKVGDTIARLCLDGSNRQPKFILPTVADRLDAGKPVDGLALEVALWCRYCAGETDDGAPISIDDVNAERLKKTSLEARRNPAAWLAMGDIFGPLKNRTPFAEAFAKALISLWKSGTRKTLEAYLSG